MNFIGDFSVVNNIVIHLGVIEIKLVQPEITGPVPGILELRVALENIILHDNGFRAVAGGIIAFAAQETISMAGDGRIDHRKGVSFSQRKHQCASQSTAVIHVIGKGFTVKKTAVADQQAIFNGGIAVYFYRIPCVAVSLCAFNVDLAAAFAHIEEIKTVRGIIAENTVLENPVTAGGSGAQTVAVPPCRLRPAIMGLFARVGFTAPVPFDGDAVKHNRAAVGTVSIPQVSFPAYPAVAGNTNVFNGPVGNPSGPDTRGSQAVNIQVFQRHIGGIRGKDSIGSPVSIGIVIPFAFYRRTGMVFHAV